MEKHCPINVDIFLFEGENTVLQWALKMKTVQIVAELWNIKCQMLKLKG